MVPRREGRDLLMKRPAVLRGTVWARGTHAGKPAVLRTTPVLPTFSFGAGVSEADNGRSFPASGNGSAVALIPGCLPDTRLRACHKPPSGEPQLPASANTAWGHEQGGVYG